MYGLNEAEWSVKLAILFAGIEESLKMVPGAAGGADEGLYGGAARVEKDDDEKGDDEEGEDEEGAWPCAACRVPRAGVLDHVLIGNGDMMRDDEDVVVAPEDAAAAPAAAAPADADAVAAAAPVMAAAAAARAAPVMAAAAAARAVGSPPVKARAVVNAGKVAANKVAQRSHHSPPDPMVAMMKGALDGFTDAAKSLAPPKVAPASVTAVLRSTIGLVIRVSGVREEALARLSANGVATVRDYFSIDSKEFLVRAACARAAARMHSCEMLRAGFVLGERPVRRACDDQLDAVAPAGALQGRRAA